MEKNENQEQLLTELPKVKNWDGRTLSQYQGFWCPSIFIPGLIAFQKHFQAQDSDIILASFPKSGTTWLKALAYCIVNRSRHAFEDSPLLTNPPHELVPFLELGLYMKNQSPRLEDFPRPRIFGTHVPYSSLPDSILDSNCRIIYVCRNPLDQFISHWHFYQGLQVQDTEPMSLDEAFEMVCKGVHGFGSIWEHVLGFWKASLEAPDKILFLKYEDMKEDINFYVKKIAEFLGCPLSEDEVTQGVIEKISKLCSFEHMKDLEANKVGKFAGGAKNSTYFRKGKVGDHKNYLTPEMIERLEKILEEKLSGSGFTFKRSSIDASK